MIATRVIFFYMMNRMHMMMSRNMLRSLEQKCKQAVQSFGLSPPMHPPVKIALRSSSVNPVGPCNESI